MDIGISTFPTAYSTDIAVVARRAEELGFESLWVPEHPIIPVHTTTPWPTAEHGKIPDYYKDVTDPFVALGRASAVTTKLKLGTGICLVPERNPLLLAKEVATLDMYSGGRFLFGIGAGWLKEETEIMGGDFERKWAQIREAVLAMKELWTETESEFHGKYYDFPPVYSFPSPVQRPHPPVLLGSNDPDKAPNAVKRVAEWGDGWIPYKVTPEQVVRGKAVIHELAEAKGRDSSKLSVSVFGQPNDRDLMKRFEDAGADRVLIDMEIAEEEAMLEHLEAAAENHPCDADSPRQA